MNDNGKNHTLIVGASSGIGEATALHLSRVDNISALARRSDKLSRLSDSNDNIFTRRIDVDSASEITEAIEECVEQNGKIDKLIYCAGKQIIAPHKRVKEDVIDSLFSVNLKGALLISSLFCSVKFSEKNAVFCAVSSIAAIKSEPGIVCYSAMKSGLDSMIRGLAKEAAPRRFVGVAPGWLDTEMTQNQPLYNESFKENLEKISPLGITSLDDVVQAIDFLTSKKAASITGQIICVDSGSSL